MTTMATDVLFELTGPQKLIWINEHLYPGTQLHTLAGAAFLRGPLDEERLEAAVAAFVAGNSAMRTVIRTVDGEPRQMFPAAAPVAIGRRDFSGEPQPEAAFRRWVDATIRVPMPLLERPLYEACIVRLGQDSAALYLKAHHIIADGYALFLFLEGVLRNYSQLIETGAIARPFRSEYETFIEADRAYHGSEQYAEDHAYWSAALGALRAPARLSSEDLTVVPATAARKTYRLGADATRRLAAVSEELNASPFRVVTAVLASVIARLTGNPEVCIGTPILNRRSKRERMTFGMMVNTVPLPFVIDSKAGLATLVEDAGRLTKAAIAGSRYPSLGLRLPGGGSALSLFDVGLSYQNAPFRESYGALEVSLEWFFNGQEMSAATVHFHDRQRQGELTFDIDHRTAVVSERLVDGLAAALVEGIDKVGDAGSRQRPVTALPLTREALTLVGSPLRDDSNDLALAPSRLKAVMAAHPTRQALRWEGGAWSYAELAAEVDARLAALRAAGVERGDRVVVWAHRTPETVAMLLAAWAAGAAYVPLDAHTPAARVEAILSDAAARFLVTDCDVTALSTQGIRILDPRHARGAVTGAEWEPVRPSDLCYVIFTSGSTGRPKGVAVDHGGLAHYLAFAVERYGKGRPTSCPLFTSLGFDLTVTSLFLPLLTGGCLRIYGEDADHEGALLSRVLQDEHSEVIKLTPAHLALISRLSMPAPQVRAYVVGGEALPTATAAAIVAMHGGRAEVINEYGPTEAVVGCTIHAYHAGDVGIDVPIGLPIAGTVLRIVTPWGVDQVPGAEGELLIGGRGLAAGYLGRADLTSERFLTDGQNGGRWYKTGDKVRLRPDGELDYLGRIDRQIKIRGFRIELGEIEAAYRAETGDAACVAVDVKGAGEDRVLALFYVAPVEHEVRTLRAALARRLPDYMVPGVILRIDAVPLNANGKVDRTALQRRYDEARALTGAAPSTTDLSPEAARALALIEPLIGGAVDLRRSFVEAGGNSITAIQAISRLQAAGLGGTVRGLLRSESIGDFLAGLGDVAVKSVRAPISGPLAQPLPAARWFLAEGFVRAEHWHQSVLLRPRALLDPVRLGEALHAVVRAHDALRLNVADDGKSLLLNPVHLEVTPVVTRRVLAAAGEAARRDSIVAAAQEVKRGFDLRRDLLLKATLLDFGDGDVRLLLVGHHLVVDVVSWHVLLADLSAAYAALDGGGTPALAPEGTSFVEWCEAVAGLAESLAPGEEALFRDAVTAARAIPALPTRLLEQGASAVQTLRVELGDAAAQALLGNANQAFSTQPHELILAAAVAATARHFGRDAVSIEYESHGRHELTSDQDLTRTVGWLTALTPLVFAAPSSERPELLVIDVKDRLRRLPGNGLGYGAVRERCGGVGLHPMLRFNYLGLAAAATEDAGLFELAPEPTGPDVAPENHATAAVEMIVQVKDSGFEVTLQLDARRFDAESANRFAARLAEETQAMAHLCLAQEKPRLTPSDFAAAELTLDELDSLFTTSST
ncbi:amino acid adenylation domain-containing protein [Archangium lipolyticum]|uniref:amino acid adenylation domain-containing protein n=1 Tax=Archangium lipolyticum TaxID=2970465 RepID=UPI00214A0EE2|nr:amino acid adenylation domain-containing protein [Archangium lipolyticum]